MLNEKIITGSSHITNYLSGASKVRPAKKMLTEKNELRTVPSVWITPTIEEFLYDIDKSINRNRYHDRIMNIIKTRQIPERNNFFENISVDFTWINIGLDDLARPLNLLPTVIEQYIRNMETILAESEINVTAELAALKTIKHELTNDVRYKKIFESFEERKDILANAKELFNKGVNEFNLENKQNMYTQILNRNIDTNPTLQHIKELADVMNAGFPEMAGENQSIADIKFLDDYVNRINETTISVFKKLRNKKEVFSIADQFFDNLKNSDTGKGITEFLKKKEEEQTPIKYTEVELEGNLYKKMMFFSDYSMLAQKATGEYIEIYNNKQIQNIRDELVVEMIKDEFKKYPQTAKALVHIVKGVDNFGFNSFQKVMSTYKENMDILKLYNVDVINTYNSLPKRESDYRTMEAVDDFLNKTIKTHKVKQYANSIGSNKYDYLYNDESYKIIEKIYDLSLKRNIFQQHIGKKLAAYKTPEEFNEALKLFYRSFNDFAKGSVLNKAENADVEVLVEQDDLLILKIHSFEESKLLGSTSWCISRDETYFNSYTSNGKEQYFIYDFTYDAEDCESMIGITLDSGSYSTAHYRDDEQAGEEAVSHFIELINETENELSLKEKAKINAPKI